MADVQPTSHDSVARSAPWGLHLVGDTASETGQGAIAVDIIAVHGLGANPDHAWVRHKDTSAGLEEDVRWLTDLLPQTLRDYRTSINARIFCFNYQSAWLGPQLSRNRLESLAVRLLDDTHNVRDKDGTASNRPLIFIGHSFGGLVIEQAIVQANSVGGRYEYLVKLVGGVVLLGTPHQGSKSQKWGSIMATLASLIGYGEDSLMKEVDEKSMKIFDLISDFKKVMISTDLAKTAVVCFYENRPTDYLSRVFKTGKCIQRQTSLMVVEETSAVLSGFNSIVLDSDHLKLNKFSSARDGNYVSVSSNLCRIAAEAPEIIQRRRKDPALNQDSHFMVPQKRVKDFIGRESLLNTVRSHFSNSQTGSPLNLVLYALGGQGKSQIALEYCRRWREMYRGVFWIDANSKTTVAQSYGTIAAELMGGSQIEATDSAVQKLVKSHLERWTEAWLLVFDNYDEPEKFSEVEQYIPSKGCGHVIFTSRNRDLDRLGRLLQIPPMATHEGVRLLLRGYNDNDIQKHHRETASKITKRLGELALAIDQAAAYINYKRIPLDRLADFLTTYEAERQKILTYTPKNFWEYKHINAFTTWELSFQQLVSGDEPWKKDAGHFLTLSAFFAPTTVSESIFRNYQKISLMRPAWIKMFTETRGTQDDEDEEDDDKNVNEENDESDSQSAETGGYTWDPNRFWDVIAKSEDLSLLQSISPGTRHEGAVFSLHPLIRDWLQLRLKSGERAKYTHEAIEALGCCAKAYDDLSTALAEKTALITHMDVCLSNDENFSEPQDRLGYQIKSYNAANLFANSYDKFGRYRDAEDLYRRTLETLRSALGEKHPATLISMNNVAYTLYRLGNYKESERMHRQALTLRETVLGKEHCDTLNSMSNLGITLVRQGKYEEAESIHRQTLTLREKLLGKEHPDTLLSMDRLAIALDVQEKYEEAERIYRVTLALGETVLGKEHPDTLLSMNNLAVYLAKQKKWDEAEPLYRETLMLRDTALGKEHPATLLSMNNLAVCLDKQKKWDEAEPLYRDTLILRETVLGKEHPDTLSSMNNLAVCLDDQKKWDEAELLYRETLMLRERIFGKKHHETLVVMCNLATMLADQERNEEAERIFHETLMLRGMVLGKDHRHTLWTRDQLVLVLRRQGKHEEAELMAAAVVTEQSETSTAACPADDPASSDSIDGGRHSLVGTHRAHLPERWKNLEGGGDDEDDGEAGGKRRERGKRRARMSRWAKRTIDAIHR